MFAEKSAKDNLGYRCKDGRTNGRTDRAKTVYLPLLRSWGIKKKSWRNRKRMFLEMVGEFGPRIAVGFDSN